MAAPCVQTAEKSHRIDTVTDTQILQRLDLRARPPCCIPDRDFQSAPNKVVISRPLHSVSPGTRNNTRSPAGGAIAFSFCVSVDKRVARPLAGCRHNTTRQNKHYLWEKKDVFNAMRSAETPTPATPPGE